MNQLSIILVNYRSEDDILRCLDSAFQWESAASFEWIVVNNDTSCTRQSEILERFPAVDWIEAGYNAGFARANNMGIRVATGNAVLLLNPDTLILDNAIEHCFSRLMEGSCIATSVQLKNPDMSPQITGNFFMTGGLNHLLPLPYLGPLLKRFALAAGKKKTNVVQAGQEENVDWINGAFLMVKKEAIHQAGLLDEDFFLYFEEIEWCSRLGRYGKLCVFGDLQSIHFQGESINKSIGEPGKGYHALTGAKGLQLLVSQHLRIRKQFGRGWFFFHLMVHTLEIPIWIAGHFFENIFRRQNPTQGYASVKEYTRNTMALWEVAGKIWRGKPWFYKMF